MSDLTTADRFELVSARKYDKITEEYTDATSHVEIDRWTQYGKDRLYLNGLKTGDGWISLKTDDAGGDRWTKVTAETDLDGDELTIRVGHQRTVSRRPAYEIVVRVHGDAFEPVAETSDEADDEDEDESDGPEAAANADTDAETEPAVACDGGRQVAVGDAYETEAYGIWRVVAEHDADEGPLPETEFRVRALDSPTAATGEEMWLTAGEVTASVTGRPAWDQPTRHVSDDTIQTAIEQHDDPDHPDATTIPEVRSLLAHVQQAVEAGWPEYMDAIELERGTIEVVAETPGLLVLSTGEDTLYERELEETYDGPISLDDVTLRVVSAVMHDVARQHAEYNWSVSYPLVVRKPDGFDAGQAYVEAVVNGLQRRGLSPGQARAYYGVRIRGLSQSTWAARQDLQQPNVSEALSAAEEKLP